MTNEDNMANEQEKKFKLSDFMKQLEKLEVEELQQVEDGVVKLLEDKREAAKEDARRRIEEIAKAAGASVKELMRFRETRQGPTQGQAKGSRRPAEIKFRHPTESSLTWTGRGRKPAWVEEHLKQGGTLEQLAVA